MKTLEQLTAIVNPSGEIANQRGALAMMHELEPGLMVKFSFGTGGLVISSSQWSDAAQAVVRQEVGIPAAELLRLVREHAAEVLTVTKRPEAGGRKPEAGGQRPVAGSRIPVVTAPSTDAPATAHRPPTL